MTKLNAGKERYELRGSAPPRENFLAKKTKTAARFSGAVFFGRNSSVGKNVHLDRLGGKNKMRTYIAIFERSETEYFPICSLTHCIHRKCGIRAIFQRFRERMDRQPFTALRGRLYLTAMLYFLAIFCSPLALLFAGRPISALFNLILYVISIALWATIILHHAGFLVWGLAFLHAVFAIHDARQARYARRIAEAGWPPY